MSKIIVENLHKSFGSKQVLDGVSFQINEGECFVIIGGSGCGKSVLIKNIALLMSPDSGNIIVDGEEISRAKNQVKENYIKDIGYLFQGGALFDSLTIWENVAFKLLRQKTSYSLAKEMAIKSLKDVGLEKRVADLFPNELSGGMLKRASLARTVITNPKIIFFDEPTTGLDPIMSEVIDNLIFKYAKESGATTITITHDMTTVQKISDRIIMLEDGKVAWQGKQKELENSKNKSVQKFFARKLA